MFRTVSHFGGSIQFCRRGGQGRNFGIGGPERPNAHSEPAEGEYDGVLTSSSIVKLYFNSYTHTIGILDEMKY